MYVRNDLAWIPASDDGWLLAEPRGGVDFDSKKCVFFFFESPLSKAHPGQDDFRMSVCLPFLKSIHRPFGRREMNSKHQSSRMVFTISFQFVKGLGSFSLIYLPLLFLE